MSNSPNGKQPLPLVQRINWNEIIQKIPIEARYGLMAVETFKSYPRCVGFVWRCECALTYYLKFRGYFQIEGLDAHLFIATKYIIDENENPIIRIYHRFGKDSDTPKTKRDWIWD